MKAERIAVGVYRVLEGYVNSYVLETEAGLVLVDCGMPKKHDRIATAVGDMGRGVKEIGRILITHHHLDHVGSLPTLAKMTGATVFVPVIDAPIIRGDRPPPPPNRAKVLGRTIGPVLAKIGPDQPACPVDAEVADGDVLDGGLRALHTPGHTLGHTSFLLDRDGGILVAGDAAAARGTKAGPPTGAVFGMFTEDLDEAVRSFRKLAALEFEVAVVGHGQPVRTGASDLFRKDLSWLPSV